MPIILNPSLHHSLNAVREIRLGKTCGVKMYIRKSDGPRAVTLADGTIMTRADLPPADTTRWVASRKIAVVRAVAGGLISRDWALSTYALSEDEFLQWEEAVAKHGAEGLKTTRLQQFR